MNQKFLDLTTQIAELNKQRNELVEKVFKEEIFSLINKYEIVNTISWTQYTPSFNDGDPCIFSRNGCNINYDEKGELNGIDVEPFARKEIYVDQNGKYVLVSNPEYREDCFNFMEELNLLLDCFSDDDFELMFGDGSSVIITKTDITVEEYYDY